MRRIFSSFSSRTIVSINIVGSSVVSVIVLSHTTSWARMRAFSRNESESSSLPPMNWYLFVDDEIWRSILFPSLFTITGPVDIVKAPICPAKSEYGWEKIIDISVIIMLFSSIYPSYRRSHRQSHMGVIVLRRLFASSGVTWYRWSRLVWRGYGHPDHAYPLSDHAAHR